MSAIGYLNNDELLVKATIHLYGTYASESLAEAIESEINRMWNHPLVVLPVKEGYYKVKFEVSVKVALSDIRELMFSNTSYEVNFVRVEEKNIVERSMMGVGLGQNSGHWLITDNLGQSTTAAHEFGHALGLPHPARLDYRNTGYPPIMAPRGTIVDAAFQWNPSVDPGMYGGTMNPKYRRVTQEEVFEVIANGQRQTDNILIIGKISNLYYDELGNHSILA